MYATVLSISNIKSLKNAVFDDSALLATYLLSKERILHFNFFQHNSNSDDKKNERNQGLNPLYFILWKAAAISLSVNMVSEKSDQGLHASVRCFLFYTSTYFLHVHLVTSSCHSQLPLKLILAVLAVSVKTMASNRSSSNSITHLGSQKRSMVFGPDLLLPEHLWDRCRPLKSCFFLGKKSIEVSWPQWKKHILYICVCGKEKWYHWSTKKWHGAEHRLFILLNTQAKSYNLCSFKTTLIPKETDYIISLTMNNSTKWIYLMHMNIYHF